MSKSKRVDTSKFVPEAVIAYADRSNREATPEPVPPQAVWAEIQQPELETPAVGAAPSPAAEPVREPEPSREEPRRRKAKPQAGTQDYQELFIHEAAITARSGKTVYISKEHHDRITKILQVIAKNDVSLFSYIYNVLEHHFSMFQEDMNELYESNLERKVF